MNDSKEPRNVTKDPAPAIEIDSILKRLEKLEGRCTQLETSLKDTITFETMAARLTGKKTIKKRRAKREWSPEEKAEFHARMVAARQGKEKARQAAGETKAKKK